MKTVDTNALACAIDTLRKMHAVANPEDLDGYQDRLDLQTAIDVLEEAYREACSHER